MADQRKPNRLAAATSPYLLQHAENPVDWHEWGEEALEEARAADKPVLLSVGYAACHWCHVMAHESFEDPDTAALMNELFVNVKVDREERPDIDAIYMEATQAMTGHGGWPMTVFLTPGGEPFFAGTYFPKEDRHGIPAFTKVLRGVADAWAERREEALGQARRVTEAIGRGLEPGREPVSEDVLLEAQSTLARGFDREHGGFGEAPKFPQPMVLELLLRMHMRGEPDALEMATTTLTRMADGGIHDHVGGGFHRYSTDPFWLVPHFEKMLYDNAQLASAYLHAWKVTGDERFLRVCRRTLDYLLREMQQDGGGFSSAQDADSEGVEGRFYVWAWDEIVAVAGEDAARALGGSPEGNWEGAIIPWTGHRPFSSPGSHEDARWGEENAVLARLYEAREERVRPATDDKVLAGWNGLAIRALAEAGAALGEPRYTQAAEASASFVLERMRRPDGRLLRAWREGRTSGPAYADDHALLALGLLALYEATFDARWFEEARALCDALLALFHDEEEGGFFQTGTDAETLVIRPKELFDTAVPSGNSAAAEALLRLTLLTGEVAYERAAAGALRVVRDVAGRASSGLGTALGAIDLYLGPSREIAIAGDPGAAGDLLAVVRERHLPNAALAAAEPGSPGAKAIPLLEGRDLVDGAPAAYVCERFVCRKPVTTAEDLAALLG